MSSLKGWAVQAYQLRPGLHRVTAADAKGRPVFTATVIQTQRTALVAALRAAGAEIA